MKKTFALTIVMFASLLSLFGQNNTLADIQQLVAATDKNTVLQVKEFPIGEVYEYAANDGGSIQVFFKKEELKKFHQESLFPFGKISTTIYFHQKMPIKIIEKEEHYNVAKDQLEKTESVLKTVFRVDIYIFDWEKGEMQVIKEGKRYMSEEYCAVYDFEPLMEVGAKLIKQ